MRKKQSIQGLLDNFKQLETLVVNQTGWGYWIAIFPSQFPSSTYENTAGISKTEQNTCHVLTRNLRPSLMIVVKKPH